MENIGRCQIFTPEEKVATLLNAIGYKHDLYGKPFLENSCGEGAVLSMAVERYIRDCLEQKLPLESIKSGLEKDIWGFEIDKDRYQKCIDNLNILVSKYNISNVKWKILKTDFLKYAFNNKFQFIAGNPPYLNYRDLSIEVRNYVKNNFTTCKKGKFDYCYAFIEKSINCLEDNGKLAYLIPTSIFKNVYAENLRTYMLPHISKIIDFKTEKVFEKALVATSILICEKNIKEKSIEYTNKDTRLKRKIKKSDLHGKWIFSKVPIENKDKNFIRFGDLFHASISIATLLNKAFIVDENPQTSKIEKQILKPAKSPRNLAYSKNENIIFPYFYNKNKLEKYSEEDFNKNYPNAATHLSKYKDDLDRRNSDTSAKWFEYGRSQALAHLNQKKLLMSTVVTDSIKVYELKKEDIPYAGIFIISKNGPPLGKAQEILQSKNFLEYVNNIGIQASGTSLRITAKDVNNYEFCMEEML